MKKILVVLLSMMVAMLCIAFTACSSTQEADVDDNAATTTETEAADDAENSDDADSTDTADADDAGDAVEESTEDSYIKYGYTGTDPVEGEVYEYMVDEMAERYDVPDDAVSVPVIAIVTTREGADGETEVCGEFQIYNYEIQGDILKCISGGSHPGVMHIVKSGDDYEVSKFDPVQDGGEFEPTAKELFGDEYDAFMKVYSDSDKMESIRAKTLADYVKANGLQVTKYQDEGWDPKELDL